MLPSLAELSNTHVSSGEIHNDAPSDVFDEASYGVWSTIMQSIDTIDVLDDLSNVVPNSNGNALPANSQTSPFAEAEAPSFLHSVGSDSLARNDKSPMEGERLDRLQEFANAFLDVSVFELAEVWLPIGESSDCLGLVTSVTGQSASNSSNPTLGEFSVQSKGKIVKFWSGAVGRAFSSGNPVWSTNRVSLSSFD